MKGLYLNMNYTIKNQVFILFKFCFNYLDKRR